MGVVAHLQFLPAKVEAGDLQNKLDSKTSPLSELRVSLRDLASMNKAEERRWMISDMYFMCTHILMHAHTCKHAHCTCMKMKQEKYNQNNIFIMSNHNGIKLKVNSKRNYTNAWVVNSGH